MRLLTFDLSSALEIGLHGEGAVLYVVNSTDELLDVAALAVPGADNVAVEDFDAIVLGADGEVDDITLRELRALGLKHAIVVISGSDNEERLARLYDFGATDVVQLPCSKRLLFRKIRALAQLASGNVLNIAHIGDIIIDLGRKDVVSATGAKVHLTGKEYAMLELLAMRRGSVITKEAFLAHLYGGMDEPDLKIVDVFICKLRAKLQDADPLHEHIATVWGRGYRIDGGPKSVVAAE